MYQFFAAALMQRRNLPRTLSHFVAHHHSLSSPRQTKTDPFSWPLVRKDLCLLDGRGLLSFELKASWDAYLHWLSAEESLWAPVQSQCWPPALQSQCFPKHRPSKPHLSGAEVVVRTTQSFILSFLGFLSRLCWVCTGSRAPHHSHPLFKSRNGKILNRLR